MAKKYGKNSLILRGHISDITEQTVGLENVLLVKAVINIPVRDDEIMRVPIEAFGEAAGELKKHNGEWIQVEGRVKGREYEEKLYLSTQIFEVMTLPMHKEEIPAPPPPKEPDYGEEDVPF